MRSAVAKGLRLKPAGLVVARRVAKSGKSTHREGATHVIREIQQAIWWLIKQVLLFVAFVATAAITPVILAVLPQLLILHNPSGDFSALAEAFVFLTPLSVALWMAFLCHWHSIRLWQREGKFSEWREAHGGFVSRNVKSTGFMFIGLIGSFVCEILFLITFQHVPYAAFDGAARFRLWFALFPFAAFAPVILLLVKRRNYSESEPLN